MADTTGSPKIDLVNYLNSLDSNVNFYALIDFIIRFHIHRKLIHIDALDNISNSDIINKILRLTSEVAWTPPISTLRKAFLVNNGKKIRLELTTMGLAGVIGPLPQHYIENASINKKSRVAICDFLNIFNNRLMKMLFHSHQKFHIELCATPPERSSHSMVLYALTGYQSLLSCDALPISKAFILNSAKFLLSSIKSSDDIESILTIILNQTVNIIPLVGSWYPAQSDALTKLGTQNSELGYSLMLGENLWIQSAKINLIIQNIRMEEFFDLLENIEVHKSRLKKVLKMICNIDILTLYYNLIPKSITPQLFSASYTHRLGWNTWLESKDNEYENQIPVSVE